MTASTEGELWTRAVLAELRAAGYRPRAWIRFAARSRGRARDRRREQPRAFRQLLIVGAAGAVPWLATALAGRATLAVAGALWWLAVILMLDWHLGMLERADGRSLGGIGAANLVTLARTAVVPVLPALPPGALAAALLFAGATDVLDGRIARRCHAESRLGLWLDPTADALVLSVGAAVLARTGLLPWWAAGLVVARFVLPACSVALVYFVAARQPPRAVTVRGRVPGAALLAGLVLAALALPGGAALTALGALGGLATFAATAVRAVRLQGASR